MALARDIEEPNPDHIFFVQRSDLIWQETQRFEERTTIAHTSRVFSGEGVRSAGPTYLVCRLEKLGYAGDYSFEVFNGAPSSCPCPRPLPARATKHTMAT